MSEEVKPLDNFVSDLEPPLDSAVNDQLGVNLVGENAPPNEALNVDLEALESASSLEGLGDTTSLSDDLSSDDLSSDDLSSDAPSSDDLSSDDPSSDDLSSDDLSSDDPSSETLSESSKSLEQAIEALTSQLDDRTGQYMRLAADFDNYRKRTAKEKGELEDRVKRNTIVELLPVIDNFERARSHIKPQTDAENEIQKSYQGIYKQLVDCLKQIGVSPMRPEGQTFDPNFHEAVMREPTNDYPEGTVIEELRRGYILGDQVIRHAMVRVAAPAEPEPSESSGDEVEKTN